MDLREANLTRTLNDGNTYAERTQNELKTFINSEFTDNPAHRIATRYGTSENEDILMFGSSNSSVKDDGKNIVLRPEKSMNEGQMFVVNSNIWIVTLVDSANESYPRGYMKQCKHELKYIDDTGVTQTIPCVIENQATVGVDATKQMAVPEGVIKAICSNYPESYDIDEGTRFILGRNAYMVTNVDDLVKGLLYLRLERDDIKKIDNTVTGVAGKTNAVVTASEDGESVVVDTTKKTLW